MNPKAHVNRYYLIAFVLALFLHLLILIFALFSHTEKAVPIMQASVAKSMPIPVAASVDAAKIDQEVQKIKAEKVRKRAQQLAKIKSIQHQADQAKSLMLKARKAQTLAKKRLATLKKQKISWEKRKKQETIKANQTLAQLKAQHQQLQKELKAIKTQKQTALMRKKQEEKEQLERVLRSQILAEQKQIAAKNARFIASEIDRYKGLILNQIAQKWIMPANINKKLSSLLLIRVAPTGMVLSVKMFKSSGNGLLDQSIITAVLKASPLIVPKDPSLFAKFRAFKLTVKPESLLSN